MNIKDIKPNPNNPRLIRDDKFKKLVQSIKDFPQMLDIRPIVLNKDNVILGGNMRYKACKEAGLKDVPVTIAKDLTPEQEMEFIIKDNTSGGEWDWDIIADEWDAEQVADWGLDVPEFDQGAEVVGNFEDKGIQDRSQFGVMVVCDNEGTQESVYKDLTGMGFNCKVVVT